MLMIKNYSSERVCKPKRNTSIKYSSIWTNPKFEFYNEMDILVVF